MSRQPVCRSQAAGPPQLPSCAQAVRAAPRVPQRGRCIPGATEKPEQFHNNSKQIDRFPCALCLWSCACFSTRMVPPERPAAGKAGRPVTVYGPSWVRSEGQSCVASFAF